MSETRTPTAPGDLYQLLFEANPQPVWVLGLHSLAFLAVNDAAVRHYGYTREEFLSMKVSDLYPPEDWDDALLQLLRVSEGGSVDATEGRHLRKGGSVCDVEVSWSPLTFRGTSGVLALVHDITERKLAEEALWASEAHLRGIIAAALDAVVVMDAEGVITSWNPRAEAIFGWSREEAIGKNAAALIVPPRYRAEHLVGLERFRRTGEGRMVGRRSELTALRRDGTEFPVELSIAALRQDGDFVFSAFIADITERKGAEEALKASEERFRALVENSTDVILLLSKDSILLYASGSLTRILGYAPGEFVGQSAFDLVYPEDQEKARAGFKDCLLQPARLVETIVRCRHKDGTLRHVEAVALNRLEEPSVRAVVVNFRDITERKRAEAALEEQRSFLRRVIDTDPSFVFAKDRHGRFTLVNQAVAEVYGTTVENLVGKTDADFNPNTDEVDAFRRDDLEVMDTRRQKQIQEVITDAQGLRRYLQTVKRPLVDSQGMAHHVLGVATDITERKLAEDALREASQFNKEIISSASEGIIVYDRELRYVLWNPAMERLTGLPAEQVLGESALDLFPHLREAGVKSAIERALTGEATTTTDIFFRVPQTGRSGWVSARYSPHRNARGEIIGVVGLVHDITARKQAEDALGQKRKARKDR
jgi:PAS domain S-box-containing protein